MQETLPAAYRLNDEKIWEWVDASCFYPEIVEYWTAMGKVVRISPCGPVDEDCLYLDDKWHSYCRWPFEWMLEKDLPEGWEYPGPKTPAKRQKKS